MPLPEGWLSDAEAAELERLAAGKVVLELGAWKGRSTVALARSADKVVSVDAHVPWQNLGEAWTEDSLPDYLAAVRQLPNVAIVIADFAVAAIFERSAFGLVFVDGLHDWDSVIRDFAIAKQFACPIALHDWGNYEVKPAIEWLGPYKPQRVVDTVAVFP